MSGLSPWTPELLIELRQLWATGLSTSQIGKRIGFSKNAVVGKAHRLDLPERPSPIVRRVEPQAHVRLAAEGMLRDGFPIADINRKLPVSIFVLQRMRHRLGLDPLAPDETTLPDMPSMDQSADAPQPVLLGPSRPAEIIPFPAHVAHARDRCTWLEGSVKPWIRCEAVVSHLGSAWCPHHYDIVYIQRRPGSERKLFG